MNYTLFIEKNKLANEQFKEIEGAFVKRRYFISNYGRVLSIPSCSSPKACAPMFLSPWIENNGYYRVNLSGKKHYIHKLVA